MFYNFYGGSFQALYLLIIFPFSENAATGKTLLNPVVLLAGALAEKEEL